MQKQIKTYLQENKIKFKHNLDDCFILNNWICIYFDWYIWLTTNFLDWDGLPFISNDLKPFIKNIQKDLWKLLNVDSLIDAHLYFKD